MSAHAAQPELRAFGRGVALPAVSADAAYTVALGIVLAWIAFKANGGLQLGPTTTIEMAVDVAGGAIAATALLVVPNLRARMWGGTAVAAFAALAGLTVLSILWAVQPSDAWLEANRTLSYAATFAAGATLVRIAPHRWACIVGATILAGVAVCGYALLTKVFPGALNPNETLARLREPFGYWNAVGLMGAMTVPGCLWLGARRTGHAALNALAYPAVGVLVVTILLAYSRGSLLALALGCAFWFAVVPLRLRGFAVLAVGSAGGLAVIAWVFGQDALTKDHVPLALRAQAGHELGIALLAMLAVLLVAGMGIGFLAARRPPGWRTRRQAGAAIIVCLGLVPVALAGALATSSRGFTGSISHGWNSLTNPHASTPANDPSRLTAVGSVRARYWNEALKIFKDNTLEGVGAGGYATTRPRYRNDNLDVRHAHGYVVQTLADLGLAGLLASLALLGAWIVAVGRSTGLRRSSRVAGFSPERVGLLTMTSVVVVFGVHSFVDWTWFIPGNAIPAMLLAGWVAGRGPLELPPRPLTRLPARMRIGLRNQWRTTAALAILVIALAVAWATWQPLRSVNAGTAALAAVEGKHLDQARKDAITAHHRNPLSIDPYFDLALIEDAAGRKDAARRALQQAVQLQPSNPETWLRLANYDFVTLHDPQAAQNELGAALYLDPRSSDALSTLLAVNRAIGAETGKTPPTPSQPTG